MTTHEQIIQHTDGKSYLVEYLGNGLVVTAVYAENGRKVDVPLHPEFKKQLQSIQKLQSTESLQSA